MMKYLNGIIEAHSGEVDRKFVMGVFDNLSDGAGGSESATDHEVHGVGTLTQKKAQLAYEEIFEKTIKLFILFFTEHMFMGGRVPKFIN